MASTNKTNHFNLSQYVGTDKPTYLNDYNTDMYNIDEAMYTNKEKSETNETNIGQLNQLTTLDNSTLVGAINEVNAKENQNSADIGVLSNLNTSAKDSTVSAINEVLANTMNPVGTIILTASNNVPEGYLVCDGSAISRTTYSNLFEALGTTYGNGDGATTFNIPNLKGKVPVGLDTNDGSFDTLGEIGGEKTHTLTIDEIPSHKHGLAWGTTTSGGLDDAIKMAAEKIGYTDDQIDNVGGGLAHNNLQPYMVLKFLIKY